MEKKNKKKPTTTTTTKNNKQTVETEAAMPTKSRFSLILVYVKDSELDTEWSVVRTV